MTFATDLDIIRGRFLSQWSAPNVTTLMAEQPEQTISPSVTFVRFSILPDETVRMSGGPGGKIATYGMVWLQIFLPKGRGTKDAYVLADQFAAIFREWASPTGPVTVKFKLEQVTAQPSGTTEKEYFSVKVVVPYTSWSRL